MNLGIIAGIASAGLWAGASTLMASATARVDALSVSAARAVWGTLFFVALLPWIIVSGGFEGLDWEAAAGVIGSALVGFALGDTLYIASLGALGVARGFTISLGLYVLLTFALSVLLLDEGLNVETAAGAALILAGVYAVALRGRQTGGGAEAEAAGSAAQGRRTLLRGLALVTAAAAFWAVATVWLDDASRGQDALAVGAVRLPATTLVLLGAAWFAPRSSLRARAIGRRDHLALLVSGVIGTGLGSLLFIYAVQEAGAGRAAVVTAISPIFAVPLGALFLRERVTPWLVAGVLTAVVGIILIS